ncbi:hypothetical protein D3C71_1862880 [compost metagenome]
MTSRPATCAGPISAATMSCWPTGMPFSVSIGIRCAPSSEATTAVAVKASTTAQNTGWRSVSRAMLGPPAPASGPPACADA